jgi:hypothetical protein
MMRTRPIDQFLFMALAPLILLGCHTETPSEVNQPWFWAQGVVAAAAHIGHTVDIANADGFEAAYELAPTPDAKEEVERKHDAINQRVRLLRDMTFNASAAIEALRSDQNERPWVEWLKVAVPIIDDIVEAAELLGVEVPQWVSSTLKMAKTAWRLP